MAFRTDVSAFFVLVVLLRRGSIFPGQCFVFWCDFLAKFLKIKNSLEIGAYAGGGSMLGNQ